MPSTFSKNAVISGEIDYFCLVCEDKLKSQENVNTHIGKVIHKKNLDQTSFIKNHEADKIRKVKKGYYCEYCNILLTTTIKVSMHVKDKKHLYNKTEDIVVTRSFKDAKWHENCVIVFDDLAIQENAWHGLMENNCAFCNVEFENESLHKSDTAHILNLIQAQLLIGDKKSLYRKIDNQTFHCVTCNEVLPLPPDGHFQQDSHDERYMQCRKEMKTLFSKKPNGDNSANKAPKSPEKTTTKPAVNTSNIDQCVPADPITVSEKLGLKNFIYTKENGDIACLLCHWDLDKSPWAVPEHLGGIHHQTILKLQKNWNEKNKNLASKDDQKESNTKKNEDKSTSKNDGGNSMIDSLGDFEKERIRVDFLSEKVNCEKCNKTLDFNVDEINKHIEEHNKPKMTTNNPRVFGDGVKDPRQTFFGTPVLLANKDNKTGKDDSEAKKFSDENSITYNFGQNTAFCKVCNTNIPTPLSSLQEHVKGAKHTQRASDVEANARTIHAAIPRKVEYETKRLKEFMASYCCLDNEFNEIVAINEKFFIDVPSFHFMRKTNSMVRCYLCDKNIEPEDTDINNHLLYDNHLPRLNFCQVIVSEETEFLRVIRDGVFHCGFCNVVFDSWKGVQDHLKTEDHKTMKLNNDWLLEEHEDTVTMMSEDDPENLGDFIRSLINRNK